jgi:hypothetical protein
VGSDLAMQPDKVSRHVLALVIHCAHPARRQRHSTMPDRHQIAVLGRPGACMCGYRTRQTFTHLGYIVFTIAIDEDSIRRKDKNPLSCGYANHFLSRLTFGRELF